MIQLPRGPDAAGGSGSRTVARFSCGPNVSTRAIEANPAAGSPLSRSRRKQGSRWANGEVLAMVEHDQRSSSRPRANIALVLVLLSCMIAWLLVVVGALALTDRKS